MGAVRVPRSLLVADLFCGAGGSSTGARRTIEQLGRRMVLTCVNHWDRAIETHKRMHPDARHYCQDVSSVRPIAVVPEGRLDLLMASPTCTYHSRARGGRPTSDQQRMDPWHVTTWLTELRVKRVIIENVPEFVDWGPVGVDGKPLRSKRGLYFREWVATLERLGYVVAWRILNCADYGDATTRQRFFLQARNDRQPIVWPSPTHSKDGRADLFGVGVQRWRPAREVIDWSLRGRSIFDRKRPLSAKTLMRIHAGIVKFGWPEPFIVVLRQHMKAQGLDAPLPTITAGGTHVGLVQPLIISTRQHTGGPSPRSADAPVPTLTATDSRLGLIEPFVLSTQSSGAPRSASEEPLPTITTGGAASPRPGCARPMLVEPFVLAQASGGAPREVSDPVPTIPCGGAHALVAPYYGSGSGLTCKSVEQPLDAITTKARFGMVIPITHAGGGNRARSTDAPLPTLTTARRGELAFITAAFGERDGQLPRVHDLEQPVPTILAQGRINLVQPARSHDILFRMLEPRELARAMSFSDGDFEYEFAGTKTEITKQIGNAVPVRTAAALVKASLHDLNP